MHSSSLRRSKVHPSPFGKPPEQGWQAEYRASRLTVADLLKRLDLDPALLPFNVDHDSDFPLRIPPHFLSLIEKRSPADPLLLQVLASMDERLNHPGDKIDPLEEAGRFDEPGVLRKYHGRALLLLSGACAIHCRYCFRRHYDYGDRIVGAGAVDDALDRLAGDSTVEEVILSGGDPLSITDAKLAHIVRRLDQIATLRCIRIHTRTITAVPSRITAGFVQALRSTSKPVSVIMHTNHARELDEVVRSGLSRLRREGILLLNQAVLLKGVNDDADTLRAHSYRLLECGVLPYYLHMLDPVAGAHSFAVGDMRARALELELRGSLPGYLVPRFVREVPGAASKIPIIDLATAENRLEEK